MPPSDFRDPVDFNSAIDDFRRARRRANVAEALAVLSGQERELVPFEEVRRRLRGVESGAPRLEEIELERIVGSVGRYRDFTRGFLPRQDSDEARWAGVRAAMDSLAGVPPIEVYRIDGVYFVKDGNHRVSVARRLKQRFIHAYVTPVHTRVPYDPDDGPDELILKEEQSDFLLETRLDELRPGADLSVTVPGQHEKLLEHIRVHRYFMGIDEDREVGWEEAVVHWYDHVYLPVIESLRRRGALRGFEGRTETDLYLWLSDHRGRLERELGWQLPSETIAAHLGPAEGRARLTPRERDEVLRAARAEHDAGAEARPGRRLSDDVLVALSDAEAGWRALDQALVVARREAARVYGLHVLPLGTDPDEAASGPAVARMRTRFEERCAASGVHGQFALSVGPVVPRILERATWVDLVVASLIRSGGPQGGARLSDEVRTLMRRSPRPLLASVPTAEASRLERPLLAFDGGVRSRESLFVAAYVAARWGVHLTVVSVAELGTSSRALEDARRYLEPYGVEATYVEARGPVVGGIVGTAEEHACDVILMGSYKYARWLEEWLGGVLEGVLLGTERPVLIT